MRDAVTRYSFRSVTECNMCGEPASSHYLLGRRLNGSQGLAPWKRLGIATTVCRCSRCGLIYTNPQPLPANLQDHYGIPPEQYWRDEYFRVSPEYFSREIATLGRLLDIKPGMQALDIGAGIGKCMIALGQAGFDAHGLEPSATFHDRALSRMGIVPDRLRHGSWDTVDYPASCFDFITFGAVLEHLHDPAGALERAMGWLRPGGLVHVEVPSSNWLVHRLINVYYRLRGCDYVGNLSPMHEPYHLFEFTPESFRAHALRTHYDVALFHYDVCESYLPPMVDWFARRWMEWTDTGMQLTVWLRKR